MDNANSARKLVLVALKIGAIELIPEGRKLRSGRISPYFFNSGLFNNGGNIYALAMAYADVIFRMISAGTKVDIIFGPAYKGIPLAVAISAVLWREYNVNIGYAFNRKEEKDHGEGGNIIGSSMAGKKVIIVDDVMTTGISSGIAVDTVHANGGIPVGCVIAFDRKEKGIETDLSAVQEFEKNYGIPVNAATDVSNLKLVLIEQMQFDDLKRLNEYQKLYGV